VRFELRVVVRNSYAERNRSAAIAPKTDTHMTLSQPIDRRGGYPVGVSIE